MTAGFLKDEDKKAEKMKDVPMGRPSQPEEQAGMAILLLSDRSSCESPHHLESGTLVWVHLPLLRSCETDRLGLRFALSFNQTLPDRPP